MHNLTQRPDGTVQEVKNLENYLRNNDFYFYNIIDCEDYDCDVGRLADYLARMYTNGTSIFVMDDEKTLSRIYMLSLQSEERRLSTLVELTLLLKNSKVTLNKHSVIEIIISLEHIKASAAFM